MPVSIKQHSEPVEDRSARAYRESRSQIELIVQQHFVGNALLAAHLAGANEYFGSALAAALDLGSVAYLAADMHWLKVSLAGPQFPIESLRDYLVVYAAAMRKAMGHAADEMAEWLEAYASSS